MTKKHYPLNKVRKAIANNGREAVARFHEECCSPREPREGGTRAIELYLAYLQWADKEGLPVLTFWQWAQHFSVLVPRLQNRVGGTRYRCSNDFGGLSLAAIITREAVPVDQIPEQWAREQGLWLVDEADGWKVCSSEWINRYQIEGRITAPTTYIHVPITQTVTLKEGSTFAITNGAPALEIILFALEAVGLKVIPVDAPVVADQKEKRTA